MATQKNFYKEESRKNWYIDLEPNQKLDNDQLQLGAILRIADATELMSKNHLKTEADLKWWRERSERQDSAIERLNNQLRTWKGVATRYKKDRDALKTSPTPNSTQNPAQ